MKHQSWQILCEQGTLPSEVANSLQISQKYFDWGPSGAGAASYTVVLQQCPNLAWTVNKYNNSHKDKPQKKFSLLEFLMRGEPLPLRSSQHPIFPLHWGAAGSCGCSVSLQFGSALLFICHSKDLKKNQPWKIRHMCLFTVESSPSAVLPIAKWRPTIRAVTFTLQRWKGRWLHPHQVWADEDSWDSVAARVSVLARWGNTTTAHPPAGMIAEAQGSESSLWSSSASSDKGDVGNPWQSCCQRANPPAQPQRRTETGKVHSQASARELTLVQIKPGLPSYFSIHGFTVPCVSLEFTAFDFLLQILFLLILYKYSVLFQINDNKITQRILEFM